MGLQEKLGALWFLKVRSVFPPASRSGRNRGGTYWQIPLDVNRAGSFLVESATPRSLLSRMRNGCRWLQRLWGKGQVGVQR